VNLRWGDRVGSCSPLQVLKAALELLAWYKLAMCFEQEEIASAMRKLFVYAKRAVERNHLR
jgi:hypothetical protein